MNCKLSNIAELIKSHISANFATYKNYISTENMLPNKKGITNASTLPAYGNVRSYQKNDILISNIRPYFKKIWKSDKNGTCSNDILIFRNKSNCTADFLYYTLFKDNFFDYMMSTSKGTKMPRGDINSIMDYEIELPSIENQNRIAKIITPLDDLIKINCKTNDYLAY